MARGGINKALVKMALERLIAKGEHPSIDAIRIELGNTGSKTTISRYLTELNDESGSRLGGKSSLSDTLSELVGNLAARLHLEAEQIVEQAKEANLNIIGSLRAKVAASDQAQMEAKRQITILESQLASSEQSRLATTHESQGLLLKIERLTQELHDKDAQIAAKDTHIESLEEKHQHARLALEHYRESVKDQREQDQRRHETQIQQLQAEMRQLNQTISIKQTDVTQLNQANAQLSTEIREVRKQLTTLDGTATQLKLQLKASEDMVTTTSLQLAALTESNSKSIKEIEDLKEHLSFIDKASRALELELVSTKTELNVKSQLLESLSGELRNYLNQVQYNQLKG
jgi:chromosome segregation ATPase